MSDALATIIESDNEITETRHVTNSPQNFQTEGGF